MKTKQNKKVKDIQYKQITENEKIQTWIGYVCAQFIVRPVISNNNNQKATHTERDTRAHAYRKQNRGTETETTTALLLLLLKF